MTLVEMQDVIRDDNQGVTLNGEQYDTKNVDQGVGNPIVMIDISADKTDDLAGDADVSADLACESLDVDDVANAADLSGDVVDEPADMSHHVHGESTEELLIASDDDVVFIDLDTYVESDRGSVEGPSSRAVVIKSEKRSSGMDVFYILYIYIYIYIYIVYNMH